jgi:hypothetical protein
MSLAPDVFVVSTGAALRAVQQQAQTIPIVMAGAGDVATNGTVVRPRRQRASRRAPQPRDELPAPYWLTSVVLIVAPDLKADVAIGIGADYSAVLDDHVVQVSRSLGVRVLLRAGLRDRRGCHESGKGDGGQCDLQVRFHVQPHLELLCNPLHSARGLISNMPTREARGTALGLDLGRIDIPASLTGICRCGRRGWRGWSLRPQQSR